LEAAECRGVTEKYPVALSVCNHSLKGQEKPAQLASSSPVGVSKKGSLEFPKTQAMLETMPAHTPTI
jgi:hypothetical protein